MDVHVQILHGKSNFICGTCSHEFTEEDDYNTHVKIHDKAKKIMVSSEEHPIPGLLEGQKSPPGLAESQTTLMKCEQCEFAFTSMMDLVSHIEMIHPKTFRTQSKQNVEVTKDKIIEIEDFTCNECEYEGKDNIDLVIHKKCQHSKTYLSSVANKDSVHEDRDITKTTKLIIA